MKNCNTSSTDNSEDRDPLHTLAALVAGQLPPSAVPSDQWPALLQTAQSHCLGPMLYWIIKSSSIDPASIENDSALAASAHKTAAADILYENAMRTITNALASKNIPAIWLKGAHLARTVYPQSSLRPMGDLDVLVPYDQRETALDVMRDLGYEFDIGVILRPNRSTRKPDEKDELYIRNLARHHYQLIGGTSDFVMVDLHFGLAAFNSIRLLPEHHINWFWEQSQPFGITKEMLGLTPEAHLLFLAAHHVLGHFGTSLMRDLDLHLLITQNDLNWSVITNKAIALGWTRAVHRSLERSAYYYSTPVPETVLTQLSSCRPGLEDPQGVINKNHPGYRFESALNKLSRLPAKEKFRYIFERVFPCNHFIRTQYNVPSDRFLWPYYPYRWFDSSCIIGHAILKRIRLAQGRKP